MQRTPWLNILIVLLTIIAASYLAQILWQLLGQFADIILLFVLAWLIAFAFGPLIDRISGRPLTPAAVALAQRLWNERGERQAREFRYTRLQAVAIVYLALALILIEAVALLVPPALMQLNQVVTQFPDFANHTAPEIARQGQEVLRRVGFTINIESALLGALGSLQSLATPALQNVVVILGGVLSLIGNLLLVLILSFFFALDGPRLFRALFRMVPDEFTDEVRMLVVTIDRTFGGFIRAQLLQALLVGVGTAILMTLFAEPFVLVASIFSGLFLMIPFVGTVLALIPPFLAALAHDPGQLPLLLALLLVYQLVVVNVIMPKLLSEALGLHPLVIIASLLIGIKVGGFWGAFFGVPVAGVVATMGLFFYRRWARERELEAKQRAALEGEVIPSAVPPPGAPGAPVSPGRDLEKARR
jgi:predicted PurR-regulated permease PerM